MENSCPFLTIIHICFLTILHHCFHTIYLQHLPWLYPLQDHNHRLVRPFDLVLLLKPSVTAIQFLLQIKPSWLFLSTDLECQVLRSWMSRNGRILLAFPFLAGNHSRMPISSFWRTSMIENGLPYRYRTCFLMSTNNSTQLIMLHSLLLLKLQSLYIDFSIMNITCMLEPAFCHIPVDMPTHVVKSKNKNLFMLQNCSIASNICFYFENLSKTSI